MTQGLKLKATGLPSSVFTFLTNTYEGNPLYAMQLTKLLKNKGAISVDRGTCMVNPEKLASVVKDIPNGIQVGGVRARGEA